MQVEQVQQELKMLLYQGNEWEKLSDDIVVDSFTSLYCRAFKIDIEQFGASQEMSERISALVQCTERTMKQVEDISHEVAIKYDMPYGMALPSITPEREEVTMPILAQGTTLSHVGRWEMATEAARRLRTRGLMVRNSWNSLGDQTVTVVNTTDGPVAMKEYHGGDRIRKFLDSMQVRMDSPISTESEEKALLLLKDKISASQYRCYLLNGAFPERSKRSPGVFYFFRKGLPVIAVSFNKNKTGKILCCLCIHPYGYYEYTTAGVMCPTDEVIAQLLLMRANEHKFWAKAGQWGVTDPRACL